MDEVGIQYRLEALEKRCKVMHARLKFASVGLCVTVVALLVFASMPRSQAAQKSSEGTDVLRVRQLMIVDEKGINRIVIGPIPDPQVRGVRMKRRSSATGIEVNDSSGNERVGLAILDDGSTVMGMDDELGQERGHLYYIPKKGAGLLLHGNNEKETISLSIPPEKESAVPKMEITDESGHSIATLPAHQ
jgi:hypothetical protein